MVYVARTTQTVRRRMFEEGEPFNGFPEGCQEDDVPAMLLALVSIVIEGTSIRDQMADTTTAALAIAQMLKLNCFKDIKDNRAHPITWLVTARHSAAEETPVPTYCHEFARWSKTNKLIQKKKERGDMRSKEYMEVIKEPTQNGK